MFLEDHGGECCGVRHIYGMDNGTEDELQRLIAQLDNERGQGNRLIEIILSDRQTSPRDGRGGMNARNPVDGWPAILLRNGFRLVSRFNNSNSSNDCFIFHRVPTFKSVAPHELPFPWENNLENGVRAAGGQGRMPNAPVAAGWAVGDRFRYTMQNSSLTNAEGTITRVRNEAENRYDVRFDNGTVRERYTDRFFQWIAPRQAPPPAPAPRVIATFYANFLTRTNLRGALFPTLEAARAAAPRCRRQDRLEILSDGTQRWTHNV